MKLKEFFINVSKTDANEGLNLDVRAKLFFAEIHSGDIQIDEKMSV